MPSYFGVKERNDIKNAALTVGLRPIAIIQDSVAASISYINHWNIDQLVCFINIGGGSLEVSVVQNIYDIHTDRRNVSLTHSCGNDNLGGNTFDDAIVQFLIKEGFSGYKSALDLQLTAKQAKMELSFNDVVYACTPYDETLISLETYKELIRPYITETCDTIKKAVEGSGKSFEEIDRFVIIGGSHNPIIRKAIVDLSKKEPYIAPNMCTCIAEGAAIHGSYLLGKKII